jgi:MFS transporter, DHA2 family, multidrug resistance protein
MVLLLAVGPKLLPEFRDESAGRLDLVSAGLSLSSVLLVIYGLKRIAEHGFTWPAAATILAGLVVGVLFIRRQRRLADPLIDLDLFRSPAFSGALVTYTLALLVAFGAYVFIAQYLQLVLGLTPLKAGLWTLPWSLGFVVGSLWTPALVHRYPRQLVMAAGMVMAAAGFVVLTKVGASSGLLPLVAASILFSVGLAPAITLVTDIVLGAAPPERAGAASALSETSAELGGALGIAILGSVGVAAYRGAMALAVPSAVPPEAVEAARSTLGGAVAAAAKLPEAVAAPLLAAAREAFTVGFQRASWISAVVCAGLAVLVWRLLPDETAGQNSGEQADEGARKASSGA